MQSLVHLKKSSIFVLLIIKMATSILSMAIALNIDQSSWLHGIEINVEQCRQLPSLCIFWPYHIQLKSQYFCTFDVWFSCTFFIISSFVKLVLEDLIIKGYL